MKRVLLTVHKFFPQHRAGTEVLTLHVAQELKRRGYAVMVLTANPPDVDARRVNGPEYSEYDYEGIPVHVVEEPLRLRDYTFKSEYVHNAVGSHVSKLLEQFAPDLVHIFHAQNLSGSLIDVAKHHNLPVICSLTDFWFICPVVQLKRPDGSLCEGPAKFALNCLTCYTPALFPPAQQIQEGLERKFPAVNAALEGLPAGARRVVVDSLTTGYCASKLPAAVGATVARPKQLLLRLNRVDAIMVPTRLMSKMFRKNGVHGALLHHVPFGIDTGPLIAHQEKQPSKTLRIGFIGTIFEHKGLDVLIKAFHCLPPQTEAELRIYGSTAQFPEYGQLMVDLAQSGANADRIQFCGTFPNSQLGSVLSSLDVLVVPSRWYENTPLVIQSAFASKTPVIATDLGGMSELVHHGKNGLLFAVNDAYSLSRQLLAVCQDRKLLASLRENIAPERSIEIMVDDIEAVYKKVLKRKERRREVFAAVEQDYDAMIPTVKRE